MKHGKQTLFFGIRGIVVFDAVSASLHSFSTTGPVEHNTFIFSYTKNVKKTNCVANFNLYFSEVLYRSVQNNRWSLTSQSWPDLNRVSELAEKRTAEIRSFSYHQERSDFWRVRFYAGIFDTSTLTFNTLTMVSKTTLIFVWLKFNSLSPHSFYDHTRTRAHSAVIHHIEIQTKQERGENEL